MDERARRSLIAVAISVAVAAGVSWAGSQHGVWVGGVSLFALCGMLAFGINWLVFIPAYIWQTERFFDLTGSITYLTVVAVALMMTLGGDPRSLLLAGMVAIWAVRLGSFLYLRIRRDGHDGRFDELKPSFPRFLLTWTLQGLWVLLTISAALAAMTAMRIEPLGWVAALGAAIWLAGFAIEVTADRQKAGFRRDPANQGQFITTGLWAWSRHPNYFGEILLWVGVAVVALPALRGWQHLTLISPVFVFLLLTRVSGVPLLEARAEARWGELPAYRAYRDRTPTLVPRLPR